MPLKTLATYATCAIDLLLQHQDETIATYLPSIAFTKVAGCVEKHVRKKPKYF
jgi:hypothetical protein